jgi:hypothetical protein
MDALGALLPDEPVEPPAAPVDPEPLMKGARDTYEQAIMEALEKQRSELEGSATPSKKKD